MYITNVTSFVQEGIIIPQNKKTAIIEMLAPLGIAAVAALLCYMAGDEFRFLQYLIVLVATTSIIVTLKIASDDPTLIECLILKSICGVMLVFDFSVLVLNIFLYHYGFKWILLFLFLPTIIIPFFIASSNNTLLRKNVKYRYKAMRIGTFGKILVGVFLLSTVYLKVVAYSDQSALIIVILIYCAILNCVMSISSTYCIQRLYFANKYNIKFADYSIKRHGRKR